MTRSVKVNLSQHKGNIIDPEILMYDRDIIDKRENPRLHRRRSCEKWEVLCCLTVHRHCSHQAKLMSVTYVTTRPESAACLLCWWRTFSNTRFSSVKPQQPPARRDKCPLEPHREPLQLFVLLLITLFSESICDTDKCNVMHDFYLRVSQHMETEVRGLCSSTRLGYMGLH